VNATRRIEPVLNRQGEPLGEITTTHEMAPVAVVKGAQDAARFLAVSILMENNRDVIELIPESELAAYLAQKAAIEVAAAEERERRRQAAAAAAEEAEQRAAEAAAKKRQKEIERWQAEQREAAMCTCTPRPAGSYGRHADACPVLTEDDRRRRLEAHRAELDRKVARLRANGGLLVAGGAR
jgi:hypothetical protein